MLRYPFYKYQKCMLTFHLILLETVYYNNRLGLGIFNYQVISAGTVWWSRIACMDKMTFGKQWRHLNVVLFGWYQMPTSYHLSSTIFLRFCTYVISTKAQNRRMRWQHANRRDIRLTVYTPTRKINAKCEAFFSFLKRDCGSDVICLDLPLENLRDVWRNQFSNFSRCP